MAYLMKLSWNRDDWPERWKELWNERAAIMEYQGNLDRPSAEREAEIDVRKQAYKEI